MIYCLDDSVYFEAADQFGKKLIFFLVPLHDADNDDGPDEYPDAADYPTEPDQEFNDSQQPFDTQQTQATEMDEEIDYGEMLTVNLIFNM